uniref:ubiquitinyl hydrolase 1 n=1 Tax=Cebus imitator TaxID=2715852 RepID=A0A2K5RJ22_CEBIM
MEFIFHEKQEGSLCAQHCLNNLLQGEYFSPVELASIAHQLDEEERMRMAEGGVTSEDYRAFLQHLSSLFVGICKKAMVTTIITHTPPLTKIWAQLVGIIMV